MRLPMPLAAPVTRQTLLSSRFMGSFLAVVRGSWPALAPAGIAFSSDAARGAAAAGHLPGTESSMDGSSTGTWSALQAPASHSCPRSAGVARSEAHTSELQSLMRISYAVCGWKKNTEQKLNYTQSQY